MLYSRVCLLKLVSHSLSQAESLRFDSFLQVCKRPGVSPERSVATHADMVAAAIVHFMTDFVGLCNV